MNNLGSIREKINELDAEILSQISSRVGYLDFVSDIKQKQHGNNNLYIDPQREFDVLERNISLGEEYGIEQYTTKIIWRGIIASANLHEQPNLQIFIPKDTNKLEMCAINLYYPISFIYNFFTNIKEINPSNHSIISISQKQLEKNETLLDMITKNNMYIYHAEGTLDGKDLVFFIGKILKLASRNIVHFYYSSEIKRIEKSKKQIFSPGYIFLGSSAPFI